MGRPRWRDYVGERRGSRVVEEELAPRHGYKRMVRVRCECGGRDIISTDAWVRNKTGKCSACTGRMGGVERLRRAAQRGTKLQLTPLDVKDVWEELERRGKNGSNT